MVARNRRVGPDSEHVRSSAGSAVSALRRRAPGTRSTSPHRPRLRSPSRCMALALFGSSGLAVRAAGPMNVVVTVARRALGPAGPLPHHRPARLRHLRRHLSTLDARIRRLPRPVAAIAVAYGGYRGDAGRRRRPGRRAAAPAAELSAMKRVRRGSGPRLRAGEAIAGAGALVLLVAMFLPWYDLEDAEQRGRHPQVTRPPSPPTPDATAGRHSTGLRCSWRSRSQPRSGSWCCGCSVPAGSR